MLNFNPGPSKVYPEVRKFLADAYDEGILSLPHRSEKFVQISKETVSLLRKKLNIPQDYFIFFVSSATECWEILSQSLVKNLSYHFYNGSFGEKWFKYGLNLNPLSKGIKFNPNEEIDIQNLEVENHADLICLTQNETSNGTQISAKTILSIYNKFQDQLIAVDATSSMAGLNLKFIKADIWFASVQKCFGLPAGLAIMVCSPKTIMRAKAIGEKKHYNSLLNIYEKMLNFQTTHTPNVLNIYLLRKILEERPEIKIVDKILVERAKSLYEFLESFSDFELLIKNYETRSNTVLAIKAKPNFIIELKRLAMLEGINLGNGYGEWQKETVRIANFPAIFDEEYERLRDFFSRNFV